MLNPCVVPDRPTTHSVSTMSALEPLEAASAPAGASRVSAMSYAESVQEELEQIQDGTSWADIMNNEPIVSVSFGCVVLNDSDLQLIGECDDVPSTIAATNFDLTDGGIGSPCNAPSVNEVPLSPPFQAMVRNLPLEGTDLESLFYLFGGGDLVREFESMSWFEMLRISRSKRSDSTRVPSLAPLPNGRF